MSPCRPPRTSACPVLRATDTPARTRSTRACSRTSPAARPQRATERRIASREGRAPGRPGDQTRHPPIGQGQRRDRQGQPPTATRRGHEEDRRQAAAAKTTGAPAEGAREPPEDGARDAGAPPKRATRPASRAQSRARAPSRAARAAPKTVPPKAARVCSAPGLRERTVPQQHRPRPAAGWRRAGGRCRGDRRRGRQGGRVGGRAGPEGPLLAAAPLDAPRRLRGLSHGVASAGGARRLIYTRATPSRRATCAAGGGPIAGRTVRSAGANRSAWTVAPHTMCRASPSAHPVGAARSRK